MGQFADNAAERAAKLNELVAEMRKMDKFRDDAKDRSLSKNIKVTMVVANKHGEYPTKLDIDSFDGLSENVLGLTNLAISKRYDEIRKILNDEFGGAYKEVSDDQ